MFTLTNYGVSWFAANPGVMPKLNRFRVGNGYGYTPDLAQTALHGAVKFLGTPSLPRAIASGEIAYDLYMDLSVGDFTWGEIGLYLNGNLFGVGVYSTLMLKTKLTEAQPGNLVSMSLVMNPGQTAVVALLNNSDNELNVTKASSVDTLPPAHLAYPNITLVANPLSPQRALLAVAEATVWNVAGYEHQVFQGILVSATANTVRIGSDLVAPDVDGDFLVQFTNGPAAGYARIVESWDSVNKTLLLRTALQVNPVSGDTILVSRWTQSVRDDSVAQSAASRDVAIQKATEASYSEIAAELAATASMTYRDAAGSHQESAGVSATLATSKAAEAAASAVRAEESADSVTSLVAASSMSADEAAASAAAAALSAASADVDASVALSHKNAAQVSSTASQVSASASAASAVLAAASETQSSSNQSAAAGSATSASISAAASAASAATATTKATQAGASAASATNYASVATDAAAEAVVSATAAEASAVNSAASAVVSSNSAAASAAEAIVSTNASILSTDQATAASASATLSSSKATESANSASASAGSAAASAASSTSSSGFNTLAQSAATAATTQAGLATDSAVSAAASVVAATTKATEASASAAASLASQLISEAAALDSETARDASETALAGALASEAISLGLKNESQAARDVAVSNAITAAAGAVTATTQAGVATTQAGIATTGGSTATTKAAEANVSKVAAETAAAASLTHSQVAGTFRTEASGFADQADASATTALTLRNETQTARDLAVASSATAATSAATSVSQATTATTQAGISTVNATTTINKAAEVSAQVAVATTARNQAEAARDTTYLNADVYDDTAAGLAATVVDEQFLIPSADGLSIQRYRHDEGPVATLVGLPYPSAGAVTVLADALIVDDQTHSHAWSVQDGFGRVAIAVEPDGEFFAKSIRTEVVEALTLTGAVDSTLPMGLGASTVLESDVAFELEDAFGRKALRLLNDGTLMVNSLSVGELTYLNGSSVPTPTNPVPTQPPAGSLTFQAEINHIITYGQSLSRGQTNGVVLTTSPVPSGLRFVGGVRADDGGVDDNVTHASLVPLIETIADTLGETPSSGTAQAVMQFVESENDIPHDSHDFKLLLSAPGQGGQSVLALSKGSIYYTRLLTDVQRGYDLSQDSGKFYAVAALTWTQGEADISLSTDPALYRERFTQLFVDVNTDAKSVTGQANDVKFIHYQVGSHAKYAVDGAETASTGGIALAQLQLQEDGVSTLACPMYQFDYLGATNVHLTAESSKWLGAYYGLAFKRTVLEGIAWSPLRPISATRQGRLIKILFSVPVGSLVVDTTWVSANENLGFEVFDNTGATIAISSVAVSSDSVVLTTSSTVPVGSVVRYALTAGTAGGQLGRTVGPRGNLRDQQGDTLVFDPTGINKPMHNWCVMFSLTMN